MTNNNDLIFKMTLFGHILTSCHYRCGIAALISILLYLDPSLISADHSLADLANDLLLAAVNMSLTLQGELMSVCYISQLAQHSGTLINLIA